MLAQSRRSCCQTLGKAVRRSPAFVAHLASGSSSGSDFEMPVQRSSNLNSEPEPLRTQHQKAELRLNAVRTSGTKFELLNLSSNPSPLAKRLTRSASADHRT